MSGCGDLGTLVPKVFLDFSPRERTAKRRERKTSDLNFTFMQTPAVKLVKFITGLFRYIKIQLDSESVRTKTKESG